MNNTTPKEIRETPATINVYPQDIWHDDLVIKANKQALLALKMAIEQALSADSSVATAEVFASDGEGYSIILEVLTGGCGDPEWRQLPLPYIDVDLTTGYNRA